VELHACDGMSLPNETSGQEVVYCGRVS